MTTNGSQPATSCSQDADTLRATLRELARRDAASTMQLAQIRAILAGVLADAGIEVTDDIVRLAVQVRAQVRALEADRAAIVEALLATGVSPASGDPVQLAAQVAEWVRVLGHDLDPSKRGKLDTRIGGFQMNLFDALTHITDNGIINAVTRDGDGTIAVDVTRLDGEHETIAIATLQPGDAAVLRALAVTASAYVDRFPTADAEWRKRMQEVVARGWDLATRMKAMGDA